MISNNEEDFNVYIHKESIASVMQAVFENIFMHTKDGSIIRTDIDSKNHQISIVNEIGNSSNDVLFSSQIGTQLIKRLSVELEYEYLTYEENGFFHTTIIFKGEIPLSYSK